MHMPVVQIRCVFVAVPQRFVGVPMAVLPGYIRFVRVVVVSVVVAVPVFMLDSGVLVFVFVVFKSRKVGTRQHYREGN